MTTEHKPFTYICRKCKHQITTHSMQTQHALASLCKPCLRQVQLDMAKGVYVKCNHAAVCDTFICKHRLRHGDVDGCGEETQCNAVHAIVKCVPIERKEDESS